VRVHVSFAALEDFPHQIDQSRLDAPRLEADADGMTGIGLSSKAIGGWPRDFGPLSLFATMRPIA
jgi:hypothetical protein